MWMCGHCETLHPLSQPTCGACGGQQSTDAGNVSIAEMAALTADAAFFKRHKPTKKRKR